MNFYFILGEYRIVLFSKVGIILFCNGADTQTGKASF